MGDAPRASIRVASNVAASGATTYHWFAVCTSRALRRALGGSALHRMSPRLLRITAALRQASNCSRDGASEFWTRHRPCSRPEVQRMQGYLQALPQVACIVLSQFLSDEENELSLREQR